MMDKEDNEGGSGWTDDDDWGYNEMDDGDKDDENSGDSDGENGDSSKNSGKNGDSSEDEVIVIDSEVKDEKAEYEISAINFTLQRTTKLVDGAPVSVKRSMSLGYRENVNITGAAPRKLFEMIQD